MAELDLTRLVRIKTADGEIRALKVGSSVWTKEEGGTPAQPDGDPVVIALSHSRAASHPNINRFTATELRSGMPYPLVHMDGRPSGITLEFVPSTTDTSASGINASQTGRPAGPATYVAAGESVAADEFTEEGFFAGPGHSIEYRFRGMDPSKSYEIEVVGSRDAVDMRIARLHGGGGSVSWNTTEDPPRSHTGVFTPSPSGALDLVQDTPGGSTWSDLGGMKLVETEGGPGGTPQDIEYIPTGAWLVPPATFEIPAAARHEGAVTIAVLIHSDAAAVPPEPAGWTTITQQSSNNLGTRVIYRAWRSGDPTVLAAEGVNAVVLRHYDGVDPASPVVEVGHAAGGGSSGSRLPALSFGGEEWVMDFYVHRSNVTPGVPPYYSEDPPQNAIRRFSGYARGFILDRGMTAGPVAETALGDFVNSGFHSYRLALRRATGTGGGGDPLPPEQEITAVVLIGDSITERSFGRSLSTPNSYMSNALGVPVYGYGWSGDRIWQTEQRADTALATFTDPGVLFVVMTGMNDVRDHRPLGGSDADDVAAEYASLIAKFNGRLVQFGGITFARFTSSLAYMLQNEHEGVRPFNDILYPLMPAASRNIDGNPYLDTFNWSRNDPSLIDDDGFHLSSSGESALRDFYIARLKWLIDKTSAPAPILPLEPHEIDPSIGPEPEGRVVVLSFQHNVDASPPVNSFHRDVHLHSGQTYPLHDTDEQPTAATVEWLTTTSSTGSGGIGANTNGIATGGTYATGGMLSDDITLHSWFAAEGQTLTHRFGGLLPNTDYQVDLVGVLSPSQPYGGQSSIVHGATEVTWNPQETPPRMYSLTVTTDANGSFDLVQEGIDGWNWISGIRISGDIPDPD